MDDELIIFFSIVGGILAILVDYFIAKTFQEIAEQKGHFERKYFWWTFLMGPVGMLMVVALPDLRSHPSASGLSIPVVNDDLPDL